MNIFNSKNTMKKTNDQSKVVKTSFTNNNNPRHIEPVSQKSGIRLNNSGSGSGSGTAICAINL